jgi:hypothetical protein
MDKNLDTVKYYAYLRGKCLVSHQEIIASGLITAGEADMCRRKINEMGIKLPKVTKAARQKMAREFFQAMLAHSQEVSHVE